MRKKEGIFVRVKWIEFENLKNGLKIEKINFFNDITLLVGLSGVGKTQILSAVEYSLALAVNREVMWKPCKANLGIEIENDLYEWSYQIEEDLEDNLLLSENEKYYFRSEKLLKNNQLIFERYQDSINVTGFDHIPQPKKDESLLSQYAEDINFDKLIFGIRKLYSVETELAVRGGISRENFSRFKSQISKIMGKKEKVDFSKFSHLPVAVKIYVAKNYYYEEKYVEIFDAVKELFMEIEDIDIVEDQLQDMFLVAIDVYGKTLLQYDISNGMLKTIYYLVELFTMSSDSLVLIDEFENGLGVNCIDLLCDTLLNTRKDLQFIITSHHPKIIGGIDSSKWKIIDRDCSIVKSVSSEEYGITHSQHNSYFNLINRWEYEGKI